VCDHAAKIESMKSITGHFSTMTWNKYTAIHLNRDKWGALKIIKQHNKLCITRALRRSIGV